ncbi:WAT1-related protein [Senna tora]|uniref:WAT1-related protein n=1 Tax=Senna tora TaxID=362788 RepID=A0A834X4N2_9FABA|nr:WAT1-related protein [Senna tora]
MKAQVLMILTQMGYTLLYFLTQASFNHGMSPHVYVTYRNIVAAIVMFPFAFFLERKIRPKLTLPLFLEIFMLSLFGFGLTLNMYFASLKYTNPTFVTSVTNTIASITFVLAVILRIEVINVKQPRSIAKIVGTLVSLGGAMLMTLYKGAATALKRYPAQLSLTIWMCFVGAVQSAIFTVVLEHNRSAWTIGLNIDLWSTIYGGVVASGLLVFVQLWCNEKKGPVFVTMFNPLLTILVAILSYFVFGDKLYLGCILGAIIVIIGLYLLLWGQEGDKEVHANTKQQLQNTSSDDPECALTYA